MRGGASTSGVMMDKYVQDPSLHYVWKNPKSYYLELIFSIS